MRPSSPPEDIEDASRYVSFRHESEVSRAWAIGPLRFRGGIESSHSDQSNLEMSPWALPHGYFWVTARTRACHARRTTTRPRFAREGEMRLGQEVAQTEHS